MSTLEEGDNPNYIYCQKRKHLHLTSWWQNKIVPPLNEAALLSHITGIEHISPAGPSLSQPPSRFCPWISPDFYEMQYLALFHFIVFTFLSPEAWKNELYSCKQNTVTAVIREGKLFIPLASGSVDLWSYLSPVVWLHPTQSPRRQVDGTTAARTACQPSCQPLDRLLCKHILNKSKCNILLIFWWLKFF